MSLEGPVKREDVTFIPLSKLARRRKCRGPRSVLPFHLFQSPLIRPCSKFIFEALEFKALSNIFGGNESTASLPNIAYKTSLLTALGLFAIAAAIPL